MKKFLFFIFFGIFIFLTSCSAPVRGSYEWSKKYSNSGMAKNRSSQCGVKKTKKPKWAKVKYSKPKKAKSKGKKNNKKKR
jgi:hypothetical protein